jgi:V/A-type H+-transporting ATPase subunit C
VRRIRPIHDPLRFGFAVGRVRVLETRLLKRSTYERLLDASSFAEQRRILSETVYGSYLESAQTAEDVERVLDRAQLDVYRDFLETANLPEPIVAYFRTQHDFENIRGMLKAEALGIDATELLNDLGSVEAERFLAGSLPAPVDRIVRSIRAGATAEDGTLRADAIDPAVDARLFAELLEIAAESGYEHLVDLARVGVDIANVRVFVRTRLRSAPVAEAQRFFIAGGTLPLERFVEWYRLPLADAAARLGQLPVLRNLDSEALADPGRFDVVADSAAARVLAGAAMVPVGPEPVVAYVMARRAEITMLRTLLIGRLAGVATDVLRGRLRGVA